MDTTASFSQEAVVSILLVSPSWADTSASCQQDVVASILLSSWRRRGRWPRRILGDLISSQAHVQAYAPVVICERFWDRHVDTTLWFAPGNIFLES